MQNSTSKDFKTGFFLWLVIAICAAALLPITQDEAYYKLWGKNLSLGYFDHPPFIAWLTFASENFAFGLMQNRVGTIVLAGITFLVLSEILTLCNLKKSLAFYIMFSLGGLALSILTTPDTPLLCCWTCALYFALKSLDKRSTPINWILLGVFCGLGLWAKYTMLLFLPVFFFTLLFHYPSILKQARPYLTLVLAVSIFLPHIIWNKNNDWLSLKFQFGHGLNLDLAKNFYVPALPEPFADLDKSPEDYLGRKFMQPTKKMFADEEDKDNMTIEEKKFIIPSFVNNPLQFLLSQLGFWGFFVFSFLFSKFKAAKHPSEKKRRLESFPLLIWATFFPLIFFGTLSLFGKVEANWGAMYMIGACPLLGMFFEVKRKALACAAILNSLIILVYCADSRFIFMPVQNSRLLQETHGFKELAKYIEKKHGPLFADTYQIISQLKYYNPSLKIQQWPYITRLSEIGRMPEFIFYDEKSILSEPLIHLLSSRQTPPRIPDFIAETNVCIQDCKEGYLRISENTKFTQLCTVIHTWYYATYSRIETRE